MRKKECTILIIDDDTDILFTLRVFLKRFYSKVICLDSPKKIIETLGENVVDIALMDMNFKRGVQSGKEGLYWQKQLQVVSPETMVILMTAYSDVSVAVEGIKQGAFDFVMKPWDNDKLLATLNAALALGRSNKKLHKLEKITASEFQVGNKVIGNKSTSFKQCLSIVSKVADTEASILLLGENGTGKYVIAKMLHDNSSRKDKPFIHVDLGALNENIFESELFGYVKGAFTDAKENSLGRFELAEEGTIFLDEIGNLPLQLQTKLLYVLQSKSIIRLGEGKERPINVRVICATNLDLHNAVNKQLFRQDLLYRINTVEIVLPPLRERLEDIDALANYFLERNKKKYRKGRLQFSEDALQAMLGYKWPGNIRELEHLVERAVILCEEIEIGVVDMRFSNIAIETVTASLNLEEMEKLLVSKALRKHLGNISNAAKDLGLTRAALYRRMEKYNL